MELITAPDPSSPADRVSSQDLREEICGLASRISTATARLIFLVAEFDAREAWAGYGVKSCAHWLSWQCHIGTHTAREHVRVARALRALPLITAEFGAGRLSYAKVRALTRIATPDCETDLVDLALAGTTAHVERTVAAWRRVDTPTDPDQATKRSLTWYFDTDGMLVLSARLESEEGAILLTAIDTIQAKAASQPKSATDITAAEPLAAEASPTEPPADEASPNDVKAEHADAAHPEAQFMSEQGKGDGIEAGEPAPDLPPASDGTAASPAALDALLGLARAYLNGDRDTTRHPDTDLVVHLDAAVLHRDLTAGRACYESGGTLTPAHARRLACDSRLMLILTDGPDVLDVGRTRTIPAALRRALTARDGGCAAPGCTEHRPRHLHAHHVWHWADGGPTRLDNLILLCKAHHHAVHHNRLTISTPQPGQFEFHAPSGYLMQNAPALASTPAAASTDPAATFDDHLTNPTATPTTWHGEPLDLDYVLTTLMTRRDQHRQRRHQSQQNQAA